MNSINFKAYLSEELKVVEFSFHKLKFQVAFHSKVFFDETLSSYGNNIYYGEGCIKMSPLRNNFA